MTLQVFPTSPVLAFDLVFDSAFATVVSESEGEGEQAQWVDRFPKRGLTLNYPINSVSEWATLHNFFRKRRGRAEPFWLFDPKQRSWVDEYVGRGGPFAIDGAIADDGGVKTDETTAAQNATADDMTLLPAVPAVNDCYYFRAQIMFDKLTVTISIPGVGTWTIVWEYWNGASWAALSGVSDATTGFQAAAGDRDVTYTLPNDWADCEVNGINGYWIRARVSVYTSVTTQPKGTKAVYNTKTYDLPSKSTVNDASLIIYVNDVVTAKTFVSGGGGGAADRVSFADYQSTGALITVDLTGNLRIKARMPDAWSDSFFSPSYTKIQQIKLVETRSR